MEVLQQQTHYNSRCVTMADTLQQWMCYNSRNVITVDVLQRQTRYNSQCVTTTDTVQQQRYAASSSLHNSLQCKETPKGQPVYYEPNQASKLDSHLLCSLQLF